MEATTPGTTSGSWKVARRTRREAMARPEPDCRAPESSLNSFTQGSTMEDSMRIRGRYILLAIAATWLLTAVAVAGTFSIQSYSDAYCWCDGTVNPDPYHFRQ